MVLSPRGRDQEMGVKGGQEMTQEIKMLCVGANFTQGIETPSTAHMRSQILKSDSSLSRVVLGNGPFLFPAPAGATLNGHRCLPLRHNDMTSQ